MNINKKINSKGNAEQEKSYLFAGLYNNKALTKHTKGNYKQFERNLKLGKFEP